MANYIISDIHGHFQEFMQLLKAIKFTQNDHLYILGDAIDYGPESIAVLQTIANCPNMMTLLRGPHEQVMLDALSGKIPHKETVWHLHGGQQTHRDFKALPPKEQVRLYQFLERTEKI